MERRRCARIRKVHDARQDRGNNHLVDRLNVAAPSPGAPPVSDQPARRRELRLMKRRASGLLVLTTVAFVIVSILGHGHGWLGYAQAAVEASMVGGLADWFAVTALFRRPLGLPIPHTAIIRERKEQFGETLGDFVQENFLNSDVIAERIRSSRVVERAASWLAEPANAGLVAGYAADFAIGLADAVRDDDVHRLLSESVDRAAAMVTLSPLAGEALRFIMSDGRDQQLVDTALPWLDRQLDTHHDVLRRRFAQHAPRWMPNAVEDRIFERLVAGLHGFLRDAVDDPTHDLRGQFRLWIDGVITRLETSPEFLERGEALKRELLGDAPLRRWTASLWRDIKLELRTQASDPESELRRRLARAVVSAGQRVREDSARSSKAQDLALSGVRAVADNFHTEIAGLVSGTIARWDPAETSDKLELLLGPDLQFIRINGTIVGGLAGVVIFAIARAIS
jgi:uncharacterized membrane-anchored protein YjiN (DUF445 family)